MPDADQHPGDVWQAAMLPALVRLELVGDATAVRIRYRTTTGNLGYRGDSAGCTFTVVRSGHPVDEAAAELGEGEVTLALPGDAEQPAIIYLPEGMRPVILQVQPVDGSLRPAPRQPRCLVVGDHVTQGWLAASPVASWPAILGRKQGLDVVNLGFAGTTRLDAAVAQTVAATTAEAVVVSVGTGCWSRPPHSTALLAESLTGFLDLVRAGHPTVPLVVVSPLLRPAAEDVPNVFGATLADLRRAVEDVVMARVPFDPALTLVPGQPVLAEEDLADGVYPGDEGHRRVAAAVAKVLAPRAQALRQAALSRWQEEVMASTPAFAGQLGSPVPGALAPVAPVGSRSGSGSGSGPCAESRSGGGGGWSTPAGEAATAPGRAAAPMGAAPAPAPVPTELLSVPEAVAAAARASAAAARAYAETTGRVVAGAG